MKIDEKTYGAMPAELQTLFRKLPNPGSAEVQACFPETTSGAFNQAQRKVQNQKYGKFNGYSDPKQYAGDSGSAARFFQQCADGDPEDAATRLIYVPKASRRDRDEGCEALEPSEKICTTGKGLGNTLARCPQHDAPLPSGSSQYSCGCKNEFDKNRAGRQVERRNTHNTVKPTALMRYLVRLVTPPGGLVLDPFMGSGSTGKAALLEGFQFVGIEQETEYVAIAEARIAHAAQLADADRAKAEAAVPRQAELPL